MHAAGRDKDMCGTKYVTRRTWTSYMRPRLQFVYVYLSYSLLYACGHIQSPASSSGPHHKEHKAGSQALYFSQENSVSLSTPLRYFR